MKRLLLASIALLAASPAFAHPGDHFTFAAGLEHPVTGLDHLLAMALVGVWAAAFGGKRAWVWPVTFVTSLTIGAVAGHSGLTAPGIETMIALSVVALGLLVFFRAPAPLALGMAIIAPLGFVHGVAHGAEAPDGTFAIYAIGFIAATAALHAAGYGVGRLLAAHARWIGALGALAGLYMTFA